MLIKVGISKIRKRFQSAEKSVNAPTIRRLATIEITASGIEINSESIELKNALATLKVILQLPALRFGTASSAAIRNRCAVATFVSKSTSWVKYV